MFSRVGEATDIVHKEMYDFTDKGGRDVALRPEFTACVCRAFAEHRPPTPWKVWLAGPNFRYEQPQRGRYRQFDQVDIEVLGTDDPYVDVEVIALGWQLLPPRSACARSTLLLNSLGEPADRAALRRGPARPLRARTSTPCRRRAARRSPATRCACSTPSGPRTPQLIAAAPTIADFYGEASAAHFAAVTAGLDAPRHPVHASPRARARPRLLPPHDVRVRRRHARQRPERARRRRPLRRPGRGARRPPTPGIGFALGVDRIAARLRRRGRVRPAPGPPVDVFVVDTTGGLRGAARSRPSCAPPGCAADRAFDGRSMKSQMKAADRSGAAVAVIIGDDELAAGTAIGSTAPGRRAATGRSCRSPAPGRRPHRRLTGVSGDPRRGRPALGCVSTLG